MKALKHNSTTYTAQIITVITDCYANNTEPSNTELLALYSFVGQCICEQGEKAFVVHLAQALAEQLPQIKGFSPRNLRRMRDFYRTYENQPELMRKAQSLGWTQNAVILDCCETNEQRTFYIALAIEKSLSKLALMKAIEVDTFGTALLADTDQDTVAAVRPAVGDCATQQDTDTTITTEQPCGAFVTACEPLHQGSGAPESERQHDASFLGDANGELPEHLRPENRQQKRSSQPACYKAVKFLTNGINILFEACWHRWLFADQPQGQSPPVRWRYYFGIVEQRSAFA